MKNYNHGGDVMFPDLISLAIGASIGAGIASVIWLVFLLWMLTKSYTMGWNDAQKGKWRKSVV